MSKRRYNTSPLRRDHRLAVRITTETKQRLFRAAASSVPPATASTLVEYFIKDGLARLEHDTRFRSRQTESAGEPQDPRPPAAKAGKA